MQSTRNKLIEILAQHKHEYVSGQMLSEKLNISRSAIWKHMKALEKAGYKIEAKPRVGYQIINFPNQLNEYTLQWDLDTKWLGKSIIHKKSTVSTQIDAHKLAQNNATHGTIVIADEQTGGMGRKNREWHSAKQKGIWLSLILRPDIYPYEAPQLTLLTATVLADVLNVHPNLQVNIKWPNDILMNHRKVAGILTEMQAEQDDIQYIIIGIGINVNQQTADLPISLQKKATSLKIESKQEWSIKKIVQDILQIFEERYNHYIKHGFPKIKNKWENYGYKIGETIWIRTLKDAWQATFLGIAADGALLTKLKNGDVKKVYSAKIDWFEEDL